MVLLELLRLEGLEVIAPVEGLLDRDRAVTLEGVLLVLGGRWTFRVEEDFGACRLFWLPALDSLLFLGAPSVKMGSVNSIRAKVSVTKAILAFFRYFSVDIIHLLSSAIVSGRQAQIICPPTLYYAYFPREQVYPKLLLYLLKAATWGPVTSIPPQNHYFFSNQEGSSGQSIFHTQELNMSKKLLQVAW